MKKKTLLASVLSIAMCSSLIGGATYALFTSESKVNVSVNAGKVNVVATVNGVTAYSLGEEMTNGVWENGGVATAELNTVKLDKITPGDSAVIALNVENNSNVKIMYRMIVDCAADNGLFDGLDVTVSGVKGTFDGFAYTPWMELAPETTVENVEITVELPKEAGNEYQNKECEVNYIVQAVQWNADYAQDKTGDYYGLQKNDAGAYLINDAIDLKILAENVNNATYDYKDVTVLLNNDVDLNDSWFAPIGGENVFRGTFDGQDYTISNLKIVKGEVETGLGLFATLEGTIKNLKMENVYIKATKAYGVGAALGVGVQSKAVVDNVDVKNVTIVSNCRVGGVIGNINYGSFNNCDAEGVNLTAIPDWVGDSYDNGDKVGGVIGFSQSDSTAKHANNSAKDVYIYGYRDLGGVAGAINVTKIDAFKAENVYITLDQVTYDYGWEDMYVGNVVGRPFGGMLDETANPATGDYEVTVVGSAAPVSVTSGEVTLENEYIVNTVMTGDAVYANGEGTVVTINGGTYRSIANGSVTAVYARDNAKVVINDGTFGVEGGNATIYAKNNAVVEINGGTFYPGSADANGTKWTLNLADNTGASIVVKGGRFYGWNPADNKSENPAISFVAPGYKVVQDGDWYQVVLDANPVSTLEDLQNALNNAEEGYTVIQLSNDITGDVTVVQKPGVEILIDGNGKNYAGVILVDGKSGTYTTAGFTIQNANFVADSISADACIRLGNGTNATRYTCNVTVSGCTFDVPGAVGVKSYTGGDKNLTITNCTATSNMHSLVQAKGIDGVLVEGCKVYSKNGLNFNNSDNVTVSGCTVDVKGYAVRFGESSGGADSAETYLIKNCSLKSACDDGDAVIILRGTADYATLTIENTTLEGTTEITNTATGAKVER